MSQNFINALQITDGLVSGFASAVEAIRQRNLDRAYESSAVLSHRLTEFAAGALRIVRQQGADIDKLRAENERLRAQLHEGARTASIATAWLRLRDRRVAAAQAALQAAGLPIPDTD